jgi:hypothetical protein
MTITEKKTKGLSEKPENHCITYNDSESSSSQGAKLFWHH